MSLPVRSFIVVAAARARDSESHSIDHILATIYKRPRRYANNEKSGFAVAMRREFKAGTPLGKSRAREAVRLRDKAALRRAGLANAPYVGVIDGKPASIAVAA
jgi:hypothetical protein